MNYTLSRRKKLQIYPLGDLHIGSKFFNEDFFNLWLKTFKGSKSEKIIYLQGDLIDLATKRLGNSAYEQIMSVDDQIEYILKILRPLKKYIKGSVSGNHEERSVKEFNLDVSKLIASELECDYDTTLYHNIKINDNDYKIFAQHGSKTSNQLHLMLGQAMRSTQHIDADLFLYGHCHYGENISIPTIDINGYKRRNIVLTGHFLQYKGSYAEKMGLKPSPCSFPVINIGCNCNTDVIFYNEDECILNG